MRDAATNFLVMHGLTREQARRRASRRCIFWASVHTDKSRHQVHTAEDSLVGGVYYLSAPPGRGYLKLFDPRGLTPKDINHTPEKKNIPKAPFHRTVDITPYDGLLLLFPGWMPHKVLPSKGMNSPDSKDKKYRISISMNLKGEWQETTALNVALNQPFSPASKQSKAG